MVGEAVDHRLGGTAGSRGEDHVVRLVGYQRGLPICGQIAREVEAEGLPVARRDLACRPECPGLELARQFAVSGCRKGGIEGQKTMPLRTQAQASNTSSRAPRTTAAR